jgi:transcriptional regulator with XRE-family HTH domain
MNEMEIRHLWGERIKDERLHRSWSAEALAKELGVHRSTVVRWEAASTIPSIERRVQVAHLFGRRAKDMFDYGPEETPS